MKRLSVVAFTLVMFLALSIGSVYADTGEGNVGLPILGTSGAPALGAPNLFSGAISVLYADGTPVVLESPTVTFNLCNDNTCTTVTAMLKQTSPGVYSYSFTPPTTLTGTITIYVVANQLADDNGRIFPSVDTSIGTYAYTGSTSASSSSVPPAAGTPLPALTRQAVSTNPTPTTTTQASPLEPLLIVLSVLAVAGSLLVVSKRH